MASDGEITCTNDPNFAVIYSFLKVFGKVYGLEIPTITKLQEFVENTEEVSDPLKELHLRLLRRALRNVPSNRWERCLIKFCHQHSHHQEAWEIERFSYKKASTQVKLKVLKWLLEYQFTCHAKFKTAVNAITCKELRLDPVGRDKSGCVYWLQVDHDANLCLYKEDQDEETWQLIARNRDELVKVISQLKNGEEISPSTVCNTNEDSSSADVPTEETNKPEADEENEEEFLSPESESEHEDEQKSTKPPEVKDEESPEETPEEKEHQEIETSEPSNNEPEKRKSPQRDHSLSPSKEKCSEGDRESPEKEITKSSKNQDLESPTDNPNSPKDKPDSPIDKLESSIDNPESSIDKPECSKDETESSIDKPESSTDKTESSIDKPESPKVRLDSPKMKPESPTKKPVRSPSQPRSPAEEEDSPKDDKPESPKIDKLEKSTIEKAESSHKETDTETQEELKTDMVSETIEEPVMVVTGEGNGEDCESSYLGEEIIEDVMFFYGEGCGYDNDTGNPEAIEQEENAAENSGEENGNNDDCLNGENHELSNSSKTRSVRNVKLRSKLPAVTKRTLKKQCTDTSETLKPDGKKHCVRNLDKSDSSNSKGANKDLRREASVNEKTTDSESPSKNNVKRGRNRVKKKVAVTRKLRIKEPKEVLNSVAETDNGLDSKTSIIEKRKSSLSSEDQEEVDHTENDKEKSPNKELKADDALPPKKLRLETTPESDDAAPHSKETVESVNNSETKDQIDDCVNAKKVENNPISQRKKIKARKGKFKRKKIQNKIVTDNEKSDKISDNDKKENKIVIKNKSLKRSLLDSTFSDKNKSESHSDSEEDEPVTSGKRLKIKPKKIVKSSRKKVEAKLQEKHSSDESEEETLYSLAGKKTPKKVLKKKPKPNKQKEKPKDKSKSKLDSEDSDLAPVRQSRRIAQLKIKEEAERRHMEEVALRELKMIHKKKNKDDEEDWVAQASDASSSADARRRAARNSAPTWRASDSTGPEPDSDSDEPLFEHPHHEAEPDLDFTKSDHEFSPESDLESGEPAEPLKRARTLQEEKDDGFCKHCGSAEQPEWILLCDRCDAGYHASCLKPVLFVVPEGDWFCPPCNHEMLIESLESELTKYDELLVVVEAERARRKLEEPEIPKEEPKAKGEGDKSPSEEGSSDWSSSSEEEAVYRLRARRQLPVSYRAQEYDRLISSAIKEEYVEPTSSAGNQGRGKDISTIIEAAEEEKLKAEREAIEQGKPIEKKARKKQRRKPRKLNSLEVPSEDDDETDEDFKDTGMESSSEEISSSADRESSGNSGSSDDLPIRRTCRPENKKERSKMTESSPEVKKKKKVFDSSSESGENKEWNKKKSKSKSKKRDKRDKSSKKSRKRSGLTQYDAEGNVIRARVTYGGLSGDEPNDWSPKHRTRQRKYNYTEMPNTESEDEMHKSSGKHMPDSSDEFKVDDSDLTSDSDAERSKRRKAEAAEEATEERRKAISDLIKKTAVVPLEKLPEDVTKAKTEELQAHLDAQAAAEGTPAGTPRSTRGRGGRGGRGSRGPRGRGRGGGGGSGSGSRGPPTDEALAKLVGVKIKDLKPDGTPRPSDAEREKKRLEREAKMAEKEARKLERLQKKEEKEKLKEQKAKEREEKRLARLALQESKRMKKEKPEYPVSGPMGYGVPVRPLGGDMQRANMYGGAPMQRHPTDYPDPRFPGTPRLQVRAELRGVLTGEERHAAHTPHRPDQPGVMREGTLSVAGSPQPFKPVSEEPSIITRMPHMINQQYRGPMMYPPENSPYGPRAQNMGMYQMHPGLGGQPSRQYPPQYYSHLRGLPPGYPTQAMRPASSPGQQGSHGPHGPPTSGPHGPVGPHGPMSHGRPGSVGPPVSTHGPSGPPGSIQHRPQIPHGPPGSTHGPHGPPGTIPHGPSSHGPPGQVGPIPYRPGGMPHGPPGVQHSPGPLHGLPRPNGPPGSVSHGPPGTITHTNSMPHGPHSQLPPRPPGAIQPHPGLQVTPPVSRPSPSPVGPTPTSVAATTAAGEPPIKIKAEVKTEPEYRSPVGSPSGRPSSPRDEPPRNQVNHPKIKHTENKDRRPRYPLGPYAPQYGPYGPYAPPVTSAPGQDMTALLNLQSRLHPGQSHQTPLQRMHQIHQFLPTTHTDTKPVEPSQSPLPRPQSHGEPLPPHYLPPHLRQLPHYGMPLMRPPPPGRGSPGGLPPHYPQYTEMHRSALEKQLAAPVSLPQQMTREGPPQMTRDGMPQQMQRDGIPQQMTREGLPQQMSRDGLPQQMSRDGLPQHMQRDGIPQQMTREGVPQQMSREGISQQMQSLPQQMSREGLPQQVQRESLPQQMSREGLPQQMSREPGLQQHMQREGLPQHMQREGLPQQMQRDGLQQSMPRDTGPSQHMPRDGIPQQMLREGLPQQMSRERIQQQIAREGLQQQTPRDGLQQQMQRDGLPQQMPRDGLPQQMPRDGVPQQMPRDGLPQQLPRDGLPQQMPRDGLPQQMPRDGLPQQMPRDELPQHMPRDGLPQQMPRVGLPQQMPRDGLPQQMPRDGLPQHMQHEGLPQQMPRDGSPQQMLRDGLPQQVPREAGLLQQMSPHDASLPQKPSTPHPNERVPTERPESRESTPSQRVPDKEIEAEDNRPSPETRNTPPQPILMGDNVNKTDKPIKVEIKEERTEVPPREEGSVFGGLVSYFSSQHEDDIDT